MQSLTNLFNQNISKVLEMHTLLNFAKFETPRIQNPWNPGPTIPAMHTSCLQRWMQISGKPKEAACPHRCYNNNLPGIGESFESAILSEAEPDNDEHPGQVAVDIDEQPIIQ